MNKNTILITVGSVIAVFAFLTVAYYATNTPKVQKDYSSVTKVQPTDHVKWAKNSKHVLVEYSDLQCPACAAFHDIIQKQIESDKNITGRITFVYRNYPLPMHQYAVKAAYAAEAAGKQGKYFEMSDKMFTSQSEWSTKDPTAYFENLAKSLKLNVEQFKKDRDSEEVKNKVQADIQSGNAADVSATPTFYLDGKKLDTVNSVEEFKKLLQNTANSNQK